MPGSRAGEHAGEAADAMVSGNDAEMFFHSGFPL